MILINSGTPETLAQGKRPDKQFQQGRQAARQSVHQASGLSVCLSMTFFSTIILFIENEKQ